MAWHFKDRNYEEKFFNFFGDEVRKEFQHACEYARTRGFCSATFLYELNRVLYEIRIDAHSIEYFEGYEPDYWNDAKTITPPTSDWYLCLSEKGALQALFYDEGQWINQNREAFQETIERFTKYPEKCKWPGT